MPVRYDQDTKAKASGLVASTPGITRRSTRRSPRWPGGWG